MLHGYLAQEPTFDVASAGVDPHGLSPRAVAAMAEAGIDISGHTSNHVDDYLGQPFDLVVTVCDDARERCPVLPGANRHRHRSFSFSDPAKATGSEAEIAAEFRRVRDELVVEPSLAKSAATSPDGRRLPLPGSTRTPVSHSRLTVRRGIHHSRGHATCVMQRDRATGSGGHDRDVCVGRVYDADAGEVDGHGDGEVGVVRQHAPGGRPRQRGLGGPGQVRERLALRMRRPTTPASSAPPTGPRR